MAQPKRNIKKYPNRRLYDTEISSYITLEEVRQLVLDEEEFEVRDARSGEDLTRSVLLQIIAEHEEHGQPILSAQLLTRIIGFYGNDLQDLVSPYLEHSMQAFAEQQPHWRTQLDAARSKHPGAGIDELLQRNSSLLGDDGHAQGDRD